MVTIKMIANKCGYSLATVSKALNDAPDIGAETKELIRRMRKINPNVEINIFAAMHKVNLDTFPGYKTDGEMHSFLERL